MFALLCYYRRTFCSRSILMLICPGRYTKVFCITIIFSFWASYLSYISFLWYRTKLCHGPVLCNKNPLLYSQSLTRVFAVVRLASASGLDHLSPIPKQDFYPGEWQVARLTAFLRQAVLNGEWKEEVISCCKGGKEASIVWDFFLTIKPPTLHTPWLV